MNKLMDSRKSIMAVGLQIVLTATPIAAQQRLLVPELAVSGNLADNVRKYVVGGGYNATYELDGNKIPAKLRTLPGTNIRLTSFELDGVPYLVVSTTSPSGTGPTIDYIDKAPSSGSFVDTLLDDVIVRKGENEQKIPVTRTNQFYYDASLSNARNKIEEISEISIPNR
jgi:hypothetical protein